MEDWNTLDRGKASKVIRKTRKEKGYTIEGLVDNYLSKSTISKIENGMDYTDPIKPQTDAKL